MSHDIVFIEIGLSDTRPRHGEILSIAAVRTDRRGNVIAAFAANIRPSPEMSTKDAPEWYSPLEWSNADSFDKVWLALSVVIIPHKFGKYHVVARNAYLTRRFIVDELGREPFGCTEWLDISDLAWPLLGNSLIPDNTFDELCVHFGVGITPVDEGVESTCTALVSVYHHMMNRYKAALLGEEAVRDYGGKVLSTVRKWAGF